MTATIHLPHPVIAQAAAAMETAIHFCIVDAELQSYDIQPIALGFALIGPFGTNLRTSPAAAYMAWDGAEYIASVDTDCNLVDIYELTANEMCKRAGHRDLAEIMMPVLRACRTAYKPDIHRIGDMLRDTVFECLEVREARRVEIERDLRS